jgi:lysophospholipase L1-like esterase
MRRAVIGVGGPILITLVLNEVLVRLLVPLHTPEDYRRYSIQYLPSLFSRYVIEPVDRLVEVDREKAKGRRGSAAKTPDRAYFINELGFRGPNVPLSKPEGTTRILVLGGSAVFDVNVYDEGPVRTHDWPHQMERLLHEMGHPGVEIINAGTPSYASFDSLGRLYSQLWMLEPDYVLIYHAWNDIKYWSSKEIIPEAPLIKQYGPYDDTANPLTHYRGWLDRLLSHSQIYVNLRRRYYKWKLRPGLEGVLPEGEYSSTFGPYGPRQYRLNLELIVEASRSIGAIPVLTTQATLLTPDNTERERRSIGYGFQLMTHDALVEALDETYRQTSEVASAKKVALIDLAAEMNGRRELFADHVHTTPEGSRELAQRVAASLATQLPGRGAGSSGSGPAFRIPSARRPGRPASRLGPGPEGQAPGSQPVAQGRIELPTP